MIFREAIESSVATRDDGPGSAVIAGSHDSGGLSCQASPSMQLYQIVVQCKLIAYILMLRG